MAFDWTKWKEENWNNKSKYGKAKTALGVGVAPFQPAFVGLYGHELGKDLGRALQASGFNVDPDRFAQAGGVLGALGGAASLKYPSLNIGLNPLMNAALGASLFKKYRVDEHLGSALEDLDPLGVNRKMDNVPFWDRLTLAVSNPYMLTDLGLALKNAPGFNLIPEDTYNDYASNVISAASWLRHNTLPSKYPNVVKRESLYGTKADGTPRGLSQTPLKDWALDTVNGFINPWEWVKSYAEFYNKEKNPGEYE